VAVTSSINVIDATTDRVAQTIEVGKSPKGLPMTCDGRLVLVAVNAEERIGLVDTASRAVVGTVPAGKPHTIAIRPDGKLAYVASQAPGHFALAVVDLAARSVIRDHPTPIGRRVTWNSAMTARRCVLHAGWRQCGAGARSGIQQNCGADRRPAHRRPAHRHISPTTISEPKSVSWWYKDPASCCSFNPAANAAIRSIAIGKQPHWIDVAGDGKKVYVTNAGSNNVATVDLSSDQITNIAVGNAPRKVAVQQVAAGGGGGAQVSIVNFAFVPAQITIAPGQSVTWTNNDGAPHGLAFTDGVIVRAP